MPRVPGTLSSFNLTQRQKPWARDRTKAVTKATKAYFPPEPRMSADTALETVGRWGPRCPPALDVAHAAGFRRDTQRGGFSL